MKAEPRIFCSPYLRRPLRTLDQALDDHRANQALMQQIWYESGPREPPQPESTHAGFPREATLEQS